MKTLEKQSLFWDVNLSDIDPKVHADFVIKRILARGDLDDIEWMMKHYGKKEVKTIFLKSAHIFDKKSFYFWCFYFHLAPEKCMQKSSMKKHGMFLTR